MGVKTEKNYCIIISAKNDRITERGTWTGCLMGCMLFRTQNIGLAQEIEVLIADITLSICRSTTKTRL